jgi:hypothetical protein
MTDPLTVSVLAAASAFVLACVKLLVELRRWTPRPKRQRVPARRRDRRPPQEPLD